MFHPPSQARTYTIKQSPVSHPLCTFLFTLHWIAQNVSVQLQYDNMISCITLDTRLEAETSPADNPAITASPCSSS